MGFHQIWAPLNKFGFANLKMSQSDQYCPLQRKCGQSESHKSHLWCGVLIWGVKHLCKVSAPLERLSNVELFQLFSGQRGLGVKNGVPQFLCSIEQVWLYKLENVSKWPVLSFTKEVWPNRVSQIPSLVWSPHLGCQTPLQSFSSIGETLQCRVVPTLLWTERVLGSLSALPHLGSRWDFMWNTSAKFQLHWRNFAM